MTAPKNKADAAIKLTIKLTSFLNLASKRDDFDLALRTLRDAQLIVGLMRQPPSSSQRRKLGRLSIRLHEDILYFRSQRKLRQKQLEDLAEEMETLLDSLNSDPEENNDSS